MIFDNDKNAVCNECLMNVTKEQYSFFTINPLLHFNLYHMECYGKLSNFTIFWNSRVNTSTYLWSGAILSVISLLALFEIFNIWIALFVLAIYGVVETLRMGYLIFISLVFLLIFSISHDVAGEHMIIWWLFKIMLFLVFQVFMYYPIYRVKQLQKQLKSRLL